MAGEGWEIWNGAERQSLPQAARRRWQSWGPGDWERGGEASPLLPLSVSPCPALRCALHGDVAPRAIAIRADTMHAELIDRSRGQAGHGEPAFLGDARLRPC